MFAFRIGTVAALAPARVTVGVLAVESLDHICTIPKRPEIITSGRPRSGTAPPSPSYTRPSGLSFGELLGLRGASRPRWTCNERVDTTRMGTQRIWPRISWPWQHSIVEVGSVPTLRTPDPESEPEACPELPTVVASGHRCSKNPASEASVRRTCRCRNRGRAEHGQLEKGPLLAVILSDFAGPDAEHRLPIILGALIHGSRWHRTRAVVRAPSPSERINPKPVGQPSQKGPLHAHQQVRPPRFCRPRVGGAVERVDRGHAHLVYCLLP
eukprot:247991-Pyramimonas_sp.AAC.1